MMQVGSGLILTLDTSMKEGTSSRATGIRLRFAALKYSVKGSHNAVGLGLDRKRQAEKQQTTQREPERVQLQGSDTIPHLMHDIFLFTLTADHEPAGQPSTVGVAPGQIFEHSGGSKCFNSFVGRLARRFSLLACMTIKTRQMPFRCLWLFVLAADRLVLSLGHYACRHGDKSGPSPP